MTESSSEHMPLPPVIPTDWLQLVADDVLDPTHRSRWERFALENPQFAAALHQRATIEARFNPETTKLGIDMAVWAVEVLRSALARRGYDEDSDFSDGDDVADSRPSA